MFPPEPHFPQAALSVTEHKEGLIRALPCKMWDPSGGQVWLEDFPLAWPRLSQKGTVVWDSYCPNSCSPLLHRTQTHITVSRFCSTFSGSHTVPFTGVSSTSHTSILASQRPWTNTAVLFAFSRVSDHWRWM